MSLIVLVLRPNLKVITLTLSAYSAPSATDALVLKHHAISTNRHADSICIVLAQLKTRTKDWQRTTSENKIALGKQIFSYLWVNGVTQLSWCQWVNRMHGFEKMKIGMLKAALKGMGGYVYPCRFGICFNIHVLNNMMYYATHTKYT